MVMRSSFPLTTVLTLLLPLVSLGVLFVQPTRVLASEFRQTESLSPVQKQLSPPKAVPSPNASDDDTALPADYDSVPQPAQLKGVAAPANNKNDTEEYQPQPVQPNGESADPTRPNLKPNAASPEIVYDLSKLPEPVRQMHDALVAACKSGDVEKLRPLLSKGTDPTQLTTGDMEGDPIKFLHDQAGDEGGQEILAIMEEILDAGYVHLDAGKPSEVYVWPYFFALPLDKLTAPQRVELFRIITAGDYEDMKTVGAYIFYRLGITPQGKWAFFVAGD
jgi:hypothetical protein